MDPAMTLSLKIEVSNCIGEYIGGDFSASEPPVRSLEVRSSAYSESVDELSRIRRNIDIASSGILFATIANGPDVLWSYGGHVLVQAAFKRGSLVCRVTRSAIAWSTGRDGLVATCIFKVLDEITAAALERFTEGGLVPHG